MAPLFLFLLLFLQSSSAVSVPHRHHRRIPRPSRPTAAASPSAIIQQACAATRFPDACASTLTQSSLPASPSATDLILASLAASSSGVDAAISNARAILSSAGPNANKTTAAYNCLDVLSLSSQRLRRASLTLPSSLPDSRALASAALLYQYDCFSAFKYVNDSSRVDDAMRFLLHLTDVTSNALSLLLSYHRFGSDISLYRPPQTERDGYWDEPPTSLPGTANPTTRGVPNFPPDATVCQNAATSGCLPTVQAAVDAAPAFASKRYVIHILQGVYKENVKVPFDKTNLVFLGDGMGKTVITGNLNAGMPGLSTYNTATVAVIGDGFMARDITFENTAGPEQHQAVAFRCDSDLSVFENVEFLGHQDTLYCHSLRQYYKNCRVEGTVDFVFGNAAAVFEGCTLLVRPRGEQPEKGESNAVTAQGRTDPAQATGLVFDGCTVNGTVEYVQLYRMKPAVHKTYLGRPWKEYSRTVFLRSNLGEIVRPEGWMPWSGDFALNTLFYGEFGNYGPGSDAGSRVAWSSKVPAEHVQAYSVENFIQGDGWVST